jgi:hypothetical protein
MQSNAYVLFVCLGTGLVFGQGSQSSSSAQNSGKSNYVRRISGGVSLGVMGLPTIKNATSTTSTTTVTTDYTTTNASQRIGFGATVQGVITDHFAVNVSAMYRRIGYQMTTTVTTGTTTLTTTGTHEDTRASALEVPMTVRWYSISRRKPGPRFFGEGGVAIRDAINPRTSTDTTNSAGTIACCIATTGKTANHMTRGFVAGLGVQLIDPIGIRVVPEVRYTRWMNDTFNMFSTRTQRNQIEAVISLSF